MLLEVEKAEGVYIYSPSGKKYLDLISGVSVSNTGHRHPRVVQAIKDQVDAYMHLMVYGEFIQSPQVKYAERLAGLLPESLSCCYFVNSGSEAVEGGIKLAKKHTGRSRTISCNNSYHGSTHGALSLQGSSNYKNAFRPLLPDTFQIDFNDVNALDFIDRKTACVIIEPVQGEAGIILPENNFLKKVRQRCNEVNALLIFDEIQTGFGRTGHMFALDRYDVVPDILLLAKALGGGMPLGAFISSQEIMSSLMSDPPLGHITTFGGHPVCCAAGLASLNVIIEEELIKSCYDKSVLFKKLLNHPLIKEVRGEGLMLAIQLAGPEYVQYVIYKAPEYGLILDYFLFCDSAFRIAPPLTINNDEISLACKQLKTLLDDAERNVVRK
jgi:acetylornithine/succinyldiaminopimelate/putrescine aminotransferase